MITEITYYNTMFLGKKIWGLYKRCVITALWSTWPLTLIYAIFAINLMFIQTISWWHFRFCLHRVPSAARCFGQTVSSASSWLNNPLAKISSFFWPNRCLRHLQLSQVRFYIFLTGKQSKKFISTWIPRWYIALCVGIWYKQTWQLSLFS